MALTLADLPYVLLVHRNLGAHLIKTVSSGLFCYYSSCIIRSAHAQLVGQQPGPIPELERMVDIPGAHETPDPALNYKISGCRILQIRRKQFEVCGYGLRPVVLRIHRIPQFHSSGMR
jgi:hypothetical protein